MPNEPRTQHRSVRIPDARWAALDHAATATGSDRSKILNEFIAWFTREPGAKLPKRPAHDTAPPPTE